MQFKDMDTIDKAAVIVSSGLMFLGVVVLGLIETLVGRPYVPTTVEETNQAGEVVATYVPTIPPNLRVGLVVAGIVVLMVYGLYRMAQPGEETEEAADVDTAAD